MTSAATAATTTTATTTASMKHSSVLGDQHLSLLAPPSKDIPSMLGRLFSCCVPKDPKERNHPQLQQKYSADQDETERTALEEEEEETMTMNSFLDAVAVDEPAPLLPSNSSSSSITASHSSSSSSSSNNNNNSDKNKSAMINNLAQEILQTLLGIFMINYFLDVFRHNQQQPPKRILAAETPPLTGANTCNQDNEQAATIGTSGSTTTEFA